MATPQHPHFERKPQHFNPAILARSVIAPPLLEQIDQELAVTTTIEKEHPRMRDAHNAAIFLHPDFPGGPTAALAAVRKRLSEAARKVGAKTPPSVNAPDPKISDHVALASLEGAVIRQLLGMDAAAVPPAIERIWPSKKFNEFMTQPPAGSKIAGGAASAGEGVAKAASEAAMRAVIAFSNMRRMEL